MQVAGGLCNIPFLAPFDATHQEQDNPVFFFGEIYAIPRPVIDPQFPDTVINVLVIAKIS